MKLKLTRRTFSILVPTGQTENRRASRLETDAAGDQHQVEYDIQIPIRARQVWEFTAGPHLVLKPDDVTEAFVRETLDLDPASIFEATSDAVETVDFPDRPAPPPRRVEAV